ncbi:MAG: aldo/keto reductase [Cellulosimicrobium funkei]
MENRHLGSTGLRVSELGLGTMTWARDTDELDAAEQLRDFVDAGGTLVDTAASYADGDAESLLGSLLGAKVDRRDVLLCTKAGVRHTPSGPVVDASRGALLDSLDDSLARLGTDHVDLFLVHAPDPRTPFTETLSALRHAVTSGRTRYVGLSNHPGWATARAATLLGGTDDVGLAAGAHVLDRGRRGLVGEQRGQDAGEVHGGPSRRGHDDGPDRGGRSGPASTLRAWTHIVPRAGVRQAPATGASSERPAAAARRRARRSRATQIEFGTTWKTRIATADPTTGPAAPSGSMSTQESATLLTVMSRTGTTWNRRPRSSVMYMPGG